MWNKREEGPAPKQPEAVRSSAPAAPTAPAPAAHRPEPVTMPARQTASIGSSMYIKGDISTKEELMVDGEVEGTVESHSLLTVGRNGKVRANIKARDVVIYGSVHGNVEASDKIAIREEGSLVGNIKTAGISIDDGAYFKGSIDIVRPEPKAAVKAS